jgi:hypothetical protein
MEWLAIILSGIFAASSPAGAILDRVAVDALRSQVASVEQLAVRIDNSPSYQLLQGKIQRVRIASRGLEPIAHFRIAVLELDTDPLTLDLEKLREGGKIAKPQSLLRQPFQGAVRLALTERDINRALASADIKAKLQGLLNRALPQQGGSPLATFSLTEIRLDLLGDNRSRLYLKLQPQAAPGEETPQPLEMELTAKFAVTAGRTLEILEPEGTLNGRRLSGKLLQGFAAGLSQEYLDLRKLEPQGLTVRLLKFHIDETTMEVAAFLRLEPAQSK